MQKWKQKGTQQSRQLAHALPFFPAYLPSISYTPSPLLVKTGTLRCVSTQPRISQASSPTAMQLALCKRSAPPLPLPSGYLCLEKTQQELSPWADRACQQAVVRRAVSPGYGDVLIPSLSLLLLCLPTAATPACAAPVWTAQQRRGRWQAEGAKPVCCWAGNRFCWPHS